MLKNITISHNDTRGGDAQLNPAHFIVNTFLVLNMVWVRVKAMDMVMVQGRFRKKDLVMVRIRKLCHCSKKRTMKLNEKVEKVMLCLVHTYHD